jgi:hypothetical protein
MTATEAIDNIVKLLGLKFKSEEFAVTKLVDGITEVTNNKETDLAVGDELFVVKDSTLVPAPFGEHITREGIKVTVDEAGVIQRLETESAERVEDAVEDIRDEKEDMMSSDTLADGTKIETDEEGQFAVGQQLYFITESGEKVKAPAGEHTTQSGITIVTDGEGIITGVKYPDESGEGSLEDFQSEMKKMKEAMTEMLEVMKSMNKFTKDFEAFKTDFEEYKKQPDRAPVVRKTFASESVLDWKLELLKNSKMIK